MTELATNVDLNDQLPQRVRKFIFEHFVDHAAPPVVEQVMTAFSLSRSDATQALRTLESARHIALVKGTARILMAFPFSAVATPFRVTVRDRQYFANCAWDAIAFHAMLGDNLRVDSFCHHCAAPIEIEMTDGRATHAEPPDALVYLALRPTEWWEDIITTCSNTMVFFASPGHRDASDLGAPAQAAASLTPDQVHALSIPIYGRKLALDYARPSKQELLDHFAAMGLTGEYWQL
ncbi:MAG: organomercurial lyase [Acidimicrobiia bacterium]|nr:organomercurial lyase [Acidimicrobiia bacterium]